MSFEEKPSILVYINEIVPPLEALMEPHHMKFG